MLWSLFVIVVIAYGLMHTLLLIVIAAYALTINQRHGPLGTSRTLGRQYRDGNPRGSQDGYAR